MLGSKEKELSRLKKIESEILRLKKNELYRSTRSRKLELRREEELKRLKI